MEITLRREQKRTSEAHYFFHREAFLFDRKDTILFEWRDGPEWIMIPFRPEGESLFSLSRSSFGGIDHSRGISEKKLESFVDSVLRHPVLSGYRTVRIRSYPECYAPDNWKEQHRVLVKTGFDPVTSDENRHIRLGPEDFREIIHPSEKRCLNLAKREQWLFRKLDPVQYLTPAYQLFLASKAVKGYPMSMKEEELERMFQLFPQHYALFGVFKNNDLIAASAAIRINDQILYDFFHGESTDMRSKSPVVFLTRGLYEYARKKRMHTLDLGICSENGVRNEGLCTFKKKLGGKISRKVIYEISR